MDIKHAPLVLGNDLYVNNTISSILDEPPVYFYMCCEVTTSHYTYLTTLECRKEGHVGAKINCGVCSVLCRGADLGALSWILCMDYRDGGDIFPTLLTIIHCTDMYACIAQPGILEPMTYRPFTSVPPSLHRCHFPSRKKMRSLTG